ncbi:MAG: hypothetical protein WAO74_01195 [Polaribacter sp.]|uniref:hypothetical protein n=1 Tax=Polaribacter sp. TaxID=1920175 RepID=UPI003BB21FD2
MNKDENNPNLITEWTYSPKEWNIYVAIEKDNKKEDNIYFGIGIIIVGVFALMVFRQTSFIAALMFATVFVILIPFLRMKISYPFLKNSKSNVSVKIFRDYLLINSKKVVFFSDIRMLKSIQIIEVKEEKLLEFTIEWPTRKGPTNDEYRVLVPKNKMEEAKGLVSYFNHKTNGTDITFGDVLKTLMK